MLAAGRFEPVTSEIGFFQLDLRSATEVFTRNWHRLGYSTSVQDTARGLESLYLLEPLQASPPREILLECRNRWIAYFNCSINGTDAGSAMSSIAEAVDLRSYVVTYIPKDRRGTRPASLRFSVYEHGKGYDNLRREVMLTFDMGKYTFEQYGTPEEFEDPTKYSARRKADRFSPELLIAYMQSLGINFLDQDFYGPCATLVEHLHTGSEDFLPPPPVLTKRSIAEAQRHFHLPSIF